MAITPNALLCRFFIRIEAMWVFAVSATLIGPSCIREFRSCFAREAAKPGALTQNTDLF